MFSSQRLRSPFTSSPHNSRSKSAVGSLSRIYQQIFRQSHVSQTTTESAKFQKIHIARCSKECCLGSARVIFSLEKWARSALFFFKVGTNRPDESRCTTARRGNCTAGPLRRPPGYTAARSLAHTRPPAVPATRFRKNYPHLYTAHPRRLPERPWALNYRVGVRRRSWGCFGLLGQ